MTLFVVVASLLLLDSSTNAMVGVTSFARKRTSADIKPLVVLPPQANGLTEAAAQVLLSSYECQTIEFNGVSVATTYAKFVADTDRVAATAVAASASGSVATSTLLSSFSSLFDSNKKRNQKKLPPYVLLHGFDSSALEYRRLAPLLAETRDVYVPDILGWGFSSHEGVQSFTPEAKMSHLKSFIQTVVGQPCVIVGASLGGALAITLAVESPELVDKVVLIDAQGFIDGEGPKDIPDTVAKFGVNVLKSVPLRMFANLIAYKDKSFATWDAMRCGRLHCYTDSWERASVSFLKSGGFVVSDKVPLVKQQSLVLWGRNDEILEPSTADKFREQLPNGRVQWIENCGHVPHLEKAQEAAIEIKSFLGDK